MLNENYSATDFPSKKIGSLINHFSMIDETPYSIVVVTTSINPPTHKHADVHGY